MTHTFCGTIEYMYVASGWPRVWENNQRGPALMTAPPASQGPRDSGAQRPQPGGGLVEPGGPDVRHAHWIGKSSLLGRRVGVREILSRLGQDWVGGPLGWPHLLPPPAALHRREPEENYG